MAESLTLGDGTPLPLAPAAPEPVGQELADGEHPAPPRKDPEAPYGRRKDGVPRERPGPRSARHDRARTSQDAAAPEPVTDEVTARRRASVTDTMHVGATVCLTLYASTKNPAYQADAAVLAASAGAFAGAAAELAAVNPAFAKFIDTGGKGGAYLAFGSAVAVIGAQVAVNHGRMRPGLLGTVPLADLLPPQGKPSDGPAHPEG